jgi:transposase
MCVREPHLPALSSANSEAIVSISIAGANTNACSKTKLAEAIRYALSRRDRLTRFIGDGRIEIDSNVIERAIRPVALNRKDAFFAGSDGGAENWAIVTSFIETCKLAGVDPQAYMTDVLTKIVDAHLASKLDELMPWAFPTPIALRGVA